MRQAAMENCAWVCLGTHYPWVKIWVTADGAVSWEVGG